ncbi:autotransporter outer membrane beta-barrel domain-containing protein [Roseimicrobium sp. ORNL1]|uniref:autotransporter outer membrane beta-barrel domain-containing protein n=1 Tax=Roseimicrobium sp. ORNL1 TaxID=2711231 RepID=UPI0013E1F3E6|nr:autotransporter outer membrane beta-barrel domain-containing protein [Roseimicrobium sp. ORNL1]QIF02409.1 autotransporter outer membrane beta-barrel domain-containing protein [Roseimicrobium sp. ORNL1]
MTAILVVAFSINLEYAGMSQVVTPVSVNGTPTTVPAGSIINVANPAIPGLNAINPGGVITANNITINLGTGATIGASAASGGVIHLSGSSVLTVTTSANQRGVLSVGSGSLIDGTGTTITTGAAATTASNLNALRVESGGAATFVNAAISTRGGGNGTLNHAVFATGSGSTVSLTGGTVETLSRGSTGLRAEDGAVITLSGTQVTTTGTYVATTFLGSHALHAIGTGTEINGTGVILNVSGATGTGDAALAEGGGSISLIGSTLTANSSSPTDAAPSSAARAISGGTFQISGVGSTITATGTRGHGVSVQDAGSSASISDTAIAVSGPRAYGIQIIAGGTATVTDSSILVTQLGGVQVENIGSSIELTNTTVRTTGPTSYGVRTITGSSATITGGSVTTEGRDSAGLAASSPLGGSSTIHATNVTVVTSGIDNSMGAIADQAGDITLNGGSVTTSGNSVRAGARAHGLAARNPEASLIAIGTSVLTTGEEAMGVVADDGGVVTLLNNTITTTNRLGLGLFSVVEQVGPQFPATITGTNLTVETSGLNAYGVLAQQNFLAAPALVEIFNSSVTTHGENAVGLRAVSGGTVIAHNSSVSTQGLRAHGILARSSPSSVTVNNSNVISTGEFAHGAVAENGGLIVGNNSLVMATGNLSAALFALGEGGPVSVARFTSSRLINRSGPTIAVAGAANITLTNSFAGGSGEWLRVATAADFPLLTAPEPAIVGIPDTPDPEFPPDEPEPEPEPFAAPAIVALAATPGLANITLVNSTVVGSAFTAPGSVSNLTMVDNSLWEMTGSSNITNLHIVDSYIHFSTPTGPEFKILTINGNLSGQRGLFGMNTDLRRILGDLLVIEGLGQGNHQLLIFNRGGSPTGPGQALRVVQTTDGAAGAIFKLANPGEKVEAGVFVYRLRLGNNQGNTPDPTAWYLVNEIVDVDGGIGGGGGGGIPELSAEGHVITSTAAVLPVIWFGELNTLHERMGELRLGYAPTPARHDPKNPVAVDGKYVVPVKTPAPVQPAEQRWDVWLRGYGRRLNADPGGVSSFDEYLWGISMGVDRSFRLENGRFWLGAYGGYSGADRDFDERGEGDTESAYGGVYGTWMTDSGWYLDVVGKVNRFENELGPVSNLGEHFHSSYHNWGLGLSVEVGRQFPLGKGWFVEPQLQAAYTHITGGDYTTESGIGVNADEADVFQLRAGVIVGCRIEHNGSIWQPYVRASVIDALTEGGRINADGADLNVDLDGVRFEGGVGLITQLTSRDQLYMEYTAAFGDKIDEPWNVSLGFRRLW